MNTVSLMDTHGGQGTITLDPRQYQGGNKRRTCVATAVLLRLSRDETDVNSEDLQGFVRSELEALSAGIDDFPGDLSIVSTQEESLKLENVALDLSSVPEALVNICAPRDKI